MFRFDITHNLGDNGYIKQHRLIRQENDMTREQSLRKSLASHRIALAGAMFPGHARDLQHAISSIERALARIVKYSTK